jgi:hypothetical protein
MLQYSPYQFCYRIRKYSVKLIDKIKPATKYGIIVGSKISFGEQIQHTSDKATKGVAALGRLMPNARGPCA